MPATKTSRSRHSYVNLLRVLVQAQILLSRNNTEGVGVAHTTPPALYADHGSTLGENTELDRIHDTPLEAAVDVLLPGGLVEVGLVFGEVEGIDTAVQMRVLLN